MKKMLGISEKIFILFVLFAISILSVVKFIIAFVKESNLINLIAIDEGEDVNFSSITYIKVVIIMILCLVILLMMTSFVYLAVKRVKVKRIILVSGLFLILLIFVNFFVVRFSCGEMYSKAMFLESYDGEVLITFGVEYCRHALYLLLAAVISIIMHFVSFSLSNEYFKDQEEDVNNIQIEDGSNNITEEEKILSEEIAKLKAKVKIKDLESEYLKLKAKLDE